MAIINNYAKEKNDVDGILALSALAASSKKEDPSVINATVGMMMDENGKFVEYETIKNIVKNLSPEDKYAYAQSNGGNNYANNVEKLIFGPFLGEICKNNKLATVATPGGSGAISLVLQNYLEENNFVLLPSSMWEPYIQFVKERRLKYLTYNLYKNHKLDIESIKQTIEKVNDEKLVIVINDPCHNPTGFTMNSSDYDNLIEMLNGVNKKIIILFDISYIDYATNLGIDTRRNFLKLEKLNSNILVTFAFSGSKTFGLYGLRIGACTVLTKSEEELELFKQAADYSARATWSSPSKYGISIINNVASSENINNAFKNELKYYTDILNVRAKNFISESKKYNLPLSEYHSGFFIKVYSDNPILLAKKLIYNKVFVVPLQDSIRIALSAINSSEAKKLPEIIKKTTREMEDKN